MIAALFVEKGGTYWNLEGVDPWDEARDARLYRGPHAVVAHPDCKRWGRYWHGAPNKPHQHRMGEDGGCFAAALTAVRNYGGVLEHPAHSHAWRWFGLALPPGFVPLALDSPLPTRLEADGRLRVQLQPGVWTLAIDARYAAAAPPERLAPPAQDAPWPETEVWAWAARPELRTVSLRGAQAIDPQQTDLPADWRRLPVFALGAGLPALELVERTRGEAEAPPDRLALERTLWLDFDGGGWTVQDRIRGSVTRLDRLDAAAPLAPGRVAIAGADQFITRYRDAAGVELREGRLDLAATGRFERPAAAGALDLPAVGWRFEPQSLAATLQLPPGWRLLGANGPASADGAWLARWNLLDFFVLLLTALPVALLRVTSDGVLPAPTGEFQHCATRCQGMKPSASLVCLCLPCIDAASTCCSNSPADTC